MNRNNNGQWFKNLPEKIKNIIPVRYIVFYASIYGIIIILAFIINQFLINYQGQEKTISPLIAGGIVTLVTIFFNLLIEGAKQENEREKEIKSNIIPIYKSFFEFIEQKKTGQINKQEVSEFLNKFEANILYWGSKEIVQKWGLIKHKLPLFLEKPRLSKGEMRQLAKFLQEIRWQVGHSRNANIEKYLCQYIDDTWATNTTKNKINKIKTCKSEILELAVKYGANNIRVYISEEQNNTNKPEVDFIVKLESGRSLLDQSGLMIDLQELLGFEVYVFTENGLKEPYRERILKEAIPL